MKIEINDSNYLKQISNPEAQESEGKLMLEKLHHALTREGFNPATHNYAINDIAADDCTLICKDGIFWSVSHLERGRRHWPALFFCLEDAIRFFLMKVTNSKVSIFPLTGDTDSSHT